MVTRLRPVLQFSAWHHRLHDIFRTYEISHVCCHSSTLHPPLTYSRTTVTTVTATSYDDVVKTITVPQVTAFATTTITSGEEVQKRQIASSIPLVVAPIPVAATATADDPVISLFPSIAQNASIAAGAYSACSCLGLTSSTVTAQPTIQFV